MKKITLNLVLSLLSLVFVTQIKGEDFTIKGENKHIAARVLQDLIALSTSQPIEIYDVEMAIKACLHDFSPASTAGRTKMMRRTSEASKASTARATAR
jgi:hypothetical protein